MKTKKVIIIGSEKPVEITFRAVDTKDIKEELVCDKFCPIKNICEKLIDPDCINNPIYSFNDFCLRVGELYTKSLNWSDVELIPEITEEEAINLIGLKDV